MRRIAFVCGEFAGEAVRSAEALGALGEVSVLCESEVDKLIAAARELRSDEIVTAQETLLEPVALAREALGLPGMRAETVRRALEKPLLKQTLAAFGVRVARDRVVETDDDARRFAAEVGFPIVLKPLRGSGGLATWRIRDAEQLGLALALLRPPLLAEEFLSGEELCLDTITIDGEPRVHSICCYRPSILEALENAQVQWSCVMPRDMTPYAAFIEQGLRAVRALDVGNAMTHMEGFLLRGGDLAFTDATLRPAGARIAPMLAHAYDVDPYRAWARCVLDGALDGEWERKYAVGTLFLRGIGAGVVQSVDGISNDLVVEAKLPRVGAPKSATYTGDGYVTVRHPRTGVVEEALAAIAASARIGYSEAAPRDEAGQQWRQRSEYSEKQLYRPAWDRPAIHRGIESEEP